MHELFAKRMRLDAGELFVSVTLPAEATEPGFYTRRTREARIDYPLVTLCMARVDGRLRMAVSGAHGYPVRSEAAEKALAAGNGRPRARAEAAADAIPDRLWDDMRGSAEYRRELLVLAIIDGLAALEGV